MKRKCKKCYKEYDKKKLGIKFDMGICIRCEEELDSHNKANRKQD